MTGHGTAKKYGRNRPADPVRGRMVDYIRLMSQNGSSGGHPEANNSQRHHSNGEVKSPKTSAKRTRGGHRPTGTSAHRRARTQQQSTARGERTRAQLLRAARTVFEDAGYMDARVSDIVRQADVSHGSFYTYFGSKLEIFQEVLRQMGLAIQAAVAHHAEDVPGETIKNLHRANRRYLQAHQDHYRLMILYEQVATFDPTIAAFRVEARSRHIDRLHHTIERLQARGIADPDIDPASTASALIAMLSNYAQWWPVGPNPVDFETALSTINQIWSRALGLKDDHDQP